MLKHIILLTLVSLLAFHGLEAKKLKDKFKLYDQAGGVGGNGNQDLLNSPPHDEFVSAGNQDSNQQQQQPQQHERKHLVKPKSLKVPSAYEKCKLECKRQRDQESAQEYVERLREELQMAEEHLTQREDRVIEL